MKYLKFTYIDSVAGISIAEAPALNGPTFPAIEGLEFTLARESRYPTAVPEFFGTCPDGADTDVPGVLAELSEAEYQTALADELDARRQVKTGANNAAYERAIGNMTSDYPPSEIATWERQRAEALAWGTDPQAETPWIDIAAAARQLDRDEYLARTLAKVNAFAQASAYLTGRRQGIDDAIRAATTAEELAAVGIDYALPGAP